MFEPKFRGVPVFIAGATYIVPSLSVRQFRDNFEAMTTPLGEVNAANITAQYERMIPVIAKAMQRNYPETTEEWLWDNLDLITFKLVLDAMQGATGMKVVDPGEAAAPANSTGAGSTAQ